MKVVDGGDTEFNSIQEDCRSKGRESSSTTNPDIWDIFLNWDFTWPKTWLISFTGFDYLSKVDKNTVSLFFLKSRLILH